MCYSGNHCQMVKEASVFGFVSKYVALGVCTTYERGEGSSTTVPPEELSGIYTCSPVWSGLSC